MLWLNDLIPFPGEVQHLLLSCLFLVCVAYLFVIYQEGWPGNNATPCLGNLLVEETTSLLSWLEIPLKGKIIWEDGKEKLERHRWFVVLKKQKMWESTWMWSLSGIDSTGSFVHASCLHVWLGVVVFWLLLPADRQTALKTFTNKLKTAATESTNFWLGGIYLSI